MGFFVVYTPTGEPYFCAEPVSNATDAVNLVAAGRDDTGLLVLEPGETASARIVFAPRGPG
jgi:aldose 1-epimerase